MLLLFRNIELLKIITIERTPVQELDFYISIKDFIKKKIIKFLILTTYKNAYLRIGNSHPVSRDLSKICNCKVKTLLPFIKITKKNYLKFKKEKISLLWIGRMSAEKNIDDLINAINYLKDINFKLNILTDNKLILSNYKIDRTLYKKINLIKFDKKKISNFYKISDILISTSFYEGFPNVIASINYNCFIISADNLEVQNN